MKRTFTLLFLVHLLTRLLFICLVGVFNNYSLQPDSVWLVDFSNNAVHGNFNFELERFIASPLYPTLVALFKVVFSKYWPIALVVFQLLISALSGVYIYKIASIVFKNKNVSLIASLVFSVFPLTLWFTNTFSQECIFQSLLIFTIYFILKSIQRSNLYIVAFSAILFSLAYLTKSHFLLFSVFVPIIYFHFFGFSKQAIIYSFVFGGIALLFSLPYGMYQYGLGNSYVISSNGASYQFYLGNTEAGYKTIVDVPEKNSKDYRALKNINVTAGYFNGSQSHYDDVLKLPQKEKQQLFFKEGLQWIGAHPTKFVALKFYDLIFFLMPGLSWRHYSFVNWLASFLLSLPIYLLAYITIIKSIREKRKEILPIVYLFISMLLFSTIWYVQNRFRTITIEPFYLVCSAVLMLSIIEKFPFANKLFTRVSLFFHGANS